VNPVAALTTCGCPFIATAAGGDDDPFVIVVSCILVLLSFRSIAKIAIAHPRDVDALSWWGTPGDVLVPVRFPIAY
jgi:hypothetical protein